MAFAKIKALTGTIVLFTTLGFGLYPFNFYSKNDVDFQATPPAIRFHGNADQENYAQQGIAYLKNPIPFPANNPLTILIEARPGKVPHGLGTLVEIHDGEIQPPLVVAQWLEHLVIRSRRSNKTAGRAYQEIGLSDSLKTDEWVSLAINYTGSETRLYQNGELVEERRGYHLLERDARLSAHIVIGNSASGERPWIGSLKRVAVFQGNYSAQNTEQSPTLEYAFDGPFSETVPSRGTLDLELFIPSRFQPLERKRFAPLSSLLEREDWQVTDIATNFFGFLPCSVVIFIFFGQRTRHLWLLPAYTTAGAFVLSFLIEFSQITLPSRSPSFVDLAVNTLAGLAAGTGLFLVKLMLKPKPRTPRLTIPIE